MIDDVIRPSNSKCIYPIALEIKDTIATFKTFLYIELHQQIDNEGQWITKLDDQRTDFSFPISV